MCGHLTLRVSDAATALADVGAEETRRSEFLRRALAAGGTFVVGGVLVAGLPGLARGGPPSGAQDARILNFVLLLEYLEAAFYGEAESKGSLRGELSEFARIVGEHERAHVAFLKHALGDAAIRKPSFDFGNTTTDPKRFMATAAALEDTGVSAYNGQATNLTRKTLAAAATIVSVEARHAAWMRSIVGKEAAPDAVDAPLTEKQVQAAVKKTGFVRRQG